MTTKHWDTLPDDPVECIFCHVPNERISRNFWRCPQCNGKHQRTIVFSMGIEIDWPGHPLHGKKLRIG